MFIINLYLKNSQIEVPRIEDLPDRRLLKNTRGYKGIRHGGYVKGIRHRDFADFWAKLS